MDPSIDLGRLNTAILITCLFLLEPRPVPVVIKATHSITRVSCKPNVKSVCNRPRDKYFDDFLWFIRTRSLSPSLSFLQLCFSVSSIIVRSLIHYRRDVILIPLAVLFFLLRRVQRMSRLFDSHPKRFLIAIIMPRPFCLLHMKPLPTVAMSSSDHHSREVLYYNVKNLQTVFSHYSM